MAGEIISAEGYQKPKFEALPKITSPDGWIAPNGAFYSCKPEEHDECATFLMDTHKEIIVERLELAGEYGKAHSLEDMNPREILKSAGYALISDSVLSEANMPEKLTLRQMQEAEKAKVVFAPKSGTLDTKTYQGFKERLDDLKIADVHFDEIKRSGYENRRSVTAFLEDPTKSINIADNTSLSAMLFDELSRGFLGELRGKYRKSHAIWRKIRIGDSYAFLELDSHDHTGGGAWETTPGIEDSILLTDAKSVEKFIQEKRMLVKGDLKLISDKK